MFGSRSAYAWRRHCGGVAFLLVAKVSAISRTVHEAHLVAKQRECAHVRTHTLLQSACWKMALVTKGRSKYTLGHQHWHSGVRPFFLSLSVCLLKRFALQMQTRRERFLRNELRNTVRPARAIVCGCVRPLEPHTTVSERRETLKFCTRGRVDSAAVPCPDQIVHFFRAACDIVNGVGQTKIDSFITANDLARPFGFAIPPDCRE